MLVRLCLYLRVHETVLLLLLCVYERVRVKSQKSGRSLLRMCVCMSVNTRMRGCVSVRGPADIYIYIYIYIVCVCVCVCMCV